MKIKNFILLKHQPETVRVHPVHCPRERPSGSSSLGNVGSVLRQDTLTSKGTFLGSGS